MNPFDRRGFLKLLGMAAAGLALEEAIPLGRVWSFPTVIKLYEPAALELSSTLANLTTVYYNRQALDMLRHKFRFEPDPLYLPLRSGKTIRWNRYAPTI